MSGGKADVHEILKRVQDDINIFPKRTYSLINLFSYSPRKKAAFTLAEVLITLGIIGVVAAMTIPVLISKYQERVWLTSFKKTYSILYQAYLRASQDYGTANTWCAEGNTDCAKTYFDILSQYLKTAQIWGFNSPFDNSIRGKYRDLDGSTMGHVNVFPDNKYYNFALNDGTLIGISYSGDLNAPLLQVDTNGLKGPNQLGKDFFYISLIRRNDNPVIGGYSLWWLGSDKVYCTNAQHSGWWSGGGCSLWIISTGNMDYLHRNLTSDEWKKAVKSLLLDAYKDSLN